MCSSLGSQRNRSSPFSVGGDSRKWLRAMFLEKNRLCQTKLLNKGRGENYWCWLIPVKFSSFCCLMNMTAGLTVVYSDMWAAACFPSILGVHMRKGEYDSPLNAIRGPHSMPILGVTSSMRVYFHKKCGPKLTIGWGSKARKCSKE